MPYALGNELLERRYRVDWDVEHVKRQDPETPTPGPSPSETPTPEPEPTSVPPTSSPAAPTTPPPTSPAPTPTATPTSSPPPESPGSATPTPTPAPTPTPTRTATPTPTPTASTPNSPGESSAAASQSSASNASTRSPANPSSNAPSSPGAMQTYTIFTTNGSGQSTVIVSITSSYAVPTIVPSSKSSTHTGAIVGGVVGGVGGLLLLAAVLWFIRRKTKKDKFEENMFAPDRNVNREELDLAGDDVDDPEAMARPYHLPPSTTQNKMAMAAGSRPLSAHSQSGLSTGKPLSGKYGEAAGPVPRPTSGQSYYTQPGGGMTMPVPMRMSMDHVAYAQSQSQGNSTLDHHNPPSEGPSDTSSSARLMKDREAMRMHVANVDNDGVVVHSDAGRVNEEDEAGPREIPPTYDSIGGPSGPPGSRQ